MDGPESPRAPNAAGKADGVKVLPRRRDRWWHWLLPLAAIIVPLGAMGGGLYWLWQERVAALQAGFPAVAAALGWDASSAEVRAFGQDGLRVADLVLGSDGALAADEVVISFSPSGLLKRRIQTIQVDGLRLNARLEDGRLVLPGLFSTDTGGGETPLRLPALPFDIAVLNDVEVTVETPQGPVRLAATGQVEARGTDTAILELDVGFDGPTGLRGSLKATGRADNAGADAISLNLVFESEAKGLGLSGSGGGSVAVTLSRNGDAEAVFALDNFALIYQPQSIEIKGLSGDGSVVLEGGVPVAAAIRLDYQSIAAMGQQLMPGRGSLFLDQGAVAIDALGALPWANLALTAEGRIDDAAVPVTFALKGNSDIAPLLAAAALPLTGSGEITFDVEGAVGDPLALATAPPADFFGWFEQLTLDGEIGLGVSGLSFGEYLTGGAAAGQILVDLKPGALSLDAPGGLTLGLDRLPFALPEIAVEGLAQALGGPVTLALGGEAGTRPMLRLVQSERGYGLDFESGFDWPGLFDGIGGEVSAAVMFDRQMGVRSFKVPYLLASLAGLALEDFEGDAEILLSDVAGSPDNFSGQVSLGARSPGGAMKGFAISGLALETDGPFRFDGGFTFSPSQASTLSVARLLGPKGIAMRERMVVRLDGSQNEVRFAAGAKPAFDVTR